MAARKKTAQVRIEVLTSFNGLIAGDAGLVELDGRAQGWINAGLVKVVAGGGESTAGSGGAEPDDPGSEPAGAGGRGQATPEPGTDLGAG
ncbi:MULTISPECIES: hypothetical protein [unclassified Streptomyces]|uniref:hypothetical protein n=1 Tax=unclassified Streptomyces TaxID=2593676 RepID=UPI00159F1AF1|nr:MULTISPECIES: hypothetical protein [unclassified Streptomyces]